MKTRWKYHTASVVTGLLLSWSAGMAFAQEHAKKDSSPQSFMNEAAQGGLAEVTLGQMAAEKGRSDEVKDFGKRMVKDHSKANEELKTLAQSEGVELSTEMSPEAKKMEQRLQKLSGAEFDKAYMKEMLKDHQKDVKAFEHQASTGTDTEVRNWAAKTLPTLREHYQLGQTTAEKVGVKVDMDSAATHSMSDPTNKDAMGETATHEHMGAKSTAKDK